MPSASNRKRFGPFEVDLRTHELWKNGIRIKIVGQPLAILEVLLSRPGDLITRDEFRSRLWPADTFIDFNHGLNAAMNKLREALSDSAENPKYIETLPRRGYRFLAPVEPEGFPVAERSVSIEPPAFLQPPAFLKSMDTAPETADPFSESDHCEPPFHGFRPWWGVALLAVGVLAITGAIVLHREMFSTSLSTKSAVPTRTRALTNLPDAISDPSFSPDGNLVALRRSSSTPGNSGIFVKEVGGDRLIQLTANAFDCCPVFSPDGLSVAFSRFSGVQQTLYVLPSSGGEARRLYSVAKPHEHGELDWSPDGKTIAFSGVSSEGSYSLHTLSLEGSSTRELTTPARDEDDWGPAFSPDGQYLAFVRNRADDRSEDLMLMRLPGSEVQVLASESGGIFGAPSWSADVASVVYSAMRGGEPRLLRIRIAQKQADPTWIVEQPASHPNVSRRGYRMAYVRSLSTSAIRLVDLSQKTQEISTLPVLSSSDRNDGPQLSPDGSQLAFMSDRSGTLEIWISARNGSNPFQVTAIGNAGSPKWSPDGRKIVFDSIQAGHTQVFTVKVDSGELTAVTNDNSDNSAPSWSRDGRSIYFASNRSGASQVWKVPVSGGVPFQVTTLGGFAALESLDGQYIYYSKNGFPNPEIWRVPALGGSEARFSSVRPATWADWVVTARGIYFIAESAEGDPLLLRFDFATQKLDRSVLGGSTGGVPFYLTVSSDGQRAAFPQINQVQNTIMVTENYH